MRALVTGATGFIGQNLCLYLANMGIDFDVIKRDWDWKEIRQKYDLVFYLAGEVRNPADMYDVHVKLLYRILSESLKWDCSFVYVGSSSEYGRLDRPMKESDIINPTNMYEATKGMGTLLCQGFARQFDRSIFIVRPSSVYGKFERPEKFIPTVIRKIHNYEPIDIYPGAHDWIHVDDFIRAIFCLLMHGNPDGEIYNISSGEQFRNNILAKSIMEIMGIVVPIIVHDEKFHDHCTNNWIVDNSKLKAIGWKQQYLITAGLKKTIPEILERMSI
jgi:dTDP-glucose 4,6-dehydratase